MPRSSLSYRGEQHTAILDRRRTNGQHTDRPTKKKCERRISSSTSCSKLQGNNTPAVSYIYIHRHENILTCTTTASPSRREREKNCVICLERVTATPGETDTHTRNCLSRTREMKRLSFVISFFLSFSLKSIRRWYRRKFRARNIGGKSYETCPNDHGESNKGAIGLLANMLRLSL